MHMETAVVCPFYNLNFSKYVVFSCRFLKFTVFKFSNLSQGLWKIFNCCTSDVLSVIRQAWKIDYQYHDEPNFSANWKFKLPSQDWKVESFMMILCVATHFATDIHAAYIGGLASSWVVAGTSQRHSTSVTAIDESDWRLKPLRCSSGTTNDVVSRHTDIFLSTYGLSSGTAAHQYELNI